MADLNVAEDYWLPERLAKLSVFIELERGTYNHYLDLVSSWLDVVRDPTLRGGNIRPEALLTGDRAWRAGLDRFTNAAILPALGAAFDEQFEEGYPFAHRPYVARHLATVTNRLSQVPDDVFDEVRLELAAASGRGESIPEIAKRIKGTLLSAGSQVWRNRATVIARTETISAYNAGTNDAFQAVEEALDVPMEKVWLSTDDTRTRPTHKHADGQRVALDSKFSVGGFDLDFPGDPSGPPQEIIQCRCTMLLVEPGEELATALTAAALPLEWAVFDGFDHGGCFLEFCRNPLHPGPCKGWKHTLNKVAPGVYHALEQARVDKLNAKRKAKIKALQDAGKPVPKSLLKPITVTPPSGQAPANLAEAGTQAPLSPATEAKLAKVAKKTADAFDPKIVAEKKAAAQKKAKELADAQKPADAPQVGIPPTQDTDTKFVPTDEQAAAIAVTQVGSDLNPADAVAALGDLSPDDFAELPAPTKALIVAELGKLAHNEKLSALDKAKAAAKHKELTGELPPTPAKPTPKMARPAKAAPAPTPTPEVVDSNPPAGPADVPASVATPTAAKAADIAKNPKGTPLKDRLATYKALTQEDVDSMSVDDVAAVQKDLDAIHAWYQKKNLKTGAKQVADLKQGLQAKVDQQGPTPTSPPTPAPAKAPRVARPKKSAAPDPAKLKPTGQKLGTHGAEVYTDENGQKWLVKKQAKMLNAADVGAADLAAAAGVPTAEVHQVTIDGKPASVQKMIDAKPAFGGKKKIDPAKLTPAQVLELQKAQVLDWLTSNHDAHGGQFVEDADGNLVPIDKTQSFKHFGGDSLDPAYHPNAAYGETEPVYNQMWKAYADGADISMNDPNSGELGAFIQQVQSMPDEDLKKMFRPYAEAAAAAGKLGLDSDNPNNVDAFLDALVQRKNNLAKDFGKLHADQTAKRDAKKAPQVAKKAAPEPAKKAAPAKAAAPQSKPANDTSHYNEFQKAAVNISQKGDAASDDEKYGVIGALSKSEFDALSGDDQNAVLLTMEELIGPDTTLADNHVAIMQELYDEWTAPATPKPGAPKLDTADQQLTPGVGADMGVSQPETPTPPPTPTAKYNSFQKKAAESSAVAVAALDEGGKPPAEELYQAVAFLQPGEFLALSPQDRANVLEVLKYLGSPAATDAPAPVKQTSQKLYEGFGGTPHPDAGHAPSAAPAPTPEPAPVLPKPPKNTFDNWQGAKKVVQGKTYKGTNKLIADSIKKGTAQERLNAYSAYISSPAAFDKLPEEIQAAIVADLDNMAQAEGNFFTPQQKATALGLRQALTGKAVGESFAPTGQPKKFSSQAAEKAHHVAHNPGMHPVSERLAAYKKLSAAGFASLPPETQLKIAADLAELDLHNDIGADAGVTYAQAGEAAAIHKKLTGIDPTMGTFTTPITPAPKKAASTKGKSPAQVKAIDHASKPGLSSSEHAQVLADYDAMSTEEFEALPSTAQKKIIDQINNMGYGGSNADIAVKQAVLTKFTGSPNVKWNWKPKTAAQKKAEKLAKMSPAEIAGLNSDYTDAADFDAKLKIAIAGPAALAMAPRSYVDDFGPRSVASMPTTSNGITADQMVTSVGYYRGSGYHPMNNALRTVRDGEIHANNTTGQSIHAIDAVMNASPLPAPAQVFRGVRGQDVFGSAYHGNLLGAEVTEWAYGSSSVDRRVANNFAGSGSGALVMRTLVPAGVGAVQLSNQCAQPHGIPCEAELLLQRGLRMRVVADHGIGADGRRHIDVEVLPP